MATIYEGSTAYGDGTAEYRLELEISTTSISSVVNGTVAAYWCAVKDVDGNEGYEFYNNNSFILTINGNTIIQSDNIKSPVSVRPTGTGARVLLWSGTWQLPAGGTGAFYAKFSQTYNTKYTSSVSVNYSLGTAVPRGNLDEVTTTVAKGWSAITGSNAQFPIEVRYYNSSGTVVGTSTGTANLFREDLTDPADQVGDLSGNFSFVIPYDAPVKHGSATLTVKAFVKYNNGNSESQLIGTYTLSTANSIIVYDGQEWKTGTPHVYDGTAWKEGSKVNVHNGSAWK